MRQSAGGSRHPSVFISWAHTHRSWTAARTARWEQAVVEFAQLLRRNGVETIADLFSYTQRGVDWTRFGTTAIADTDTVLILGNLPYWERWEGRNQPNEGAGVAREADALHGLFDTDQDAFQQKVLIVLLPGETDDEMPHDLRRVPRYRVDAITAEGIDSLLRMLFDKPRYPKGELGSPPELPPSRIARPVAVPDQLPGDIRDFTGRQREMDELDGLLGPLTTAVVISAVDGSAGVGKTTLAVHWAHRVKNRFPGGRIHIDLQGYAPVPPVQPRRALGLLLGALGIADADMPTTLDARVTLYRRTLAAREILLVLDNALNVEQVRPLLPTGSSCLAVVTSRSRLTGLAVREGARLVTLDVLSPPESLSLLRQILGAGRVDDEPEAAARLAELCGHLPLALRIAAVRLVTRPGFLVADAVGELAAEVGRIDALSRDNDEHATVRSVFSWSYLRLRPAEQRVFRLLGLHRGPSLSGYAVAALTGATDVLDTLVTLHLVEEGRPGRYQIHDLLRLYAAELCRADEPPADRRAAVERMLYWYVSSAKLADTLVGGRQSDNASSLPPRADVVPRLFETADEALAWFDEEYGTMLDIAQQAYEEQLYDLCWRLPLATWSFFQRRSRWTDWIELQQLGLRAARQAGDQQAEAWILNGLGDVHDDLEHYTEALELHRQAMEIHTRLGNRKGAATALNNYAVSLENLERYAEAIERYTEVLAVFRDIGDTSGVGMVLNNLGTAHYMRDELPVAEDYYRQALDIRRQLGDTYGEGMTLHNLAEVSDAQGRLAEARDWFEQSVVAHRAAGHLRGEARALHLLGVLHHRQGDEAGARSRWQTAFEIFERVGDSEADEVLAWLHGRDHEA